LGPEERIPERGRHDSDDGDLLGVEPERPADDGGIAPETGLPEAWLRIATWVRPGTSSSAEYGRPSIGCTRKVRKKSIEASSETRHSAGWPGSARSLFQPENAVMDSKAADGPEAASARISSISAKENPSADPGR